MFKNKLFNMALIILIGITLLAGIFFVLWKTTFSSDSPTASAMKEEKVLTADQLLAQMVTTEVITTNLASKGYIVIQFGILLDNKKAKDELEKRDLQVKAIIISELASLTQEELQGREGINGLEAILMQRINAILQNGKVQKIYTVDLKFQ